MMALAPLLATVFDSIPGVVYGLPLVLAAAVVFAATHHEDSAAIRRATLEWVGWLGGILGGVLVAVWLVSWLA
jgi:small basic protein